MLIFTRDSFKTGRMFIKVTVNGIEYFWSLRPEHKNTVIDFGAAKDAVLAKYPAYFSEPA